ncbi:MAG: dockerin type I repeat-containing protein [Ruminococcus sp.]|nr:dockerin type I repeat-containing protein [Ruminococcus sp.]
MKKSKRIITSVIATVLSAVSMVGMTVCADNSDDIIMGDANADGRFTIADVTLFQNWLMGNNVTLNNYQAVDFCEDGVLDIFDLCMMKKELLNYNTSEEYPVKNPVVIDEFTPCTDTIEDKFFNEFFTITIKHQYSDPERVWTVDDFKGIENIKSVQQYYSTNPYRHFLWITLYNPSHENVLKAIHDIESLNIKEIKEIQTYKVFGVPDPDTKK